MTLEIPYHEVEYMFGMLDGERTYYKIMLDEMIRQPNETEEQFKERALKFANRESFLKGAVEKLKADLGL